MGRQNHARTQRRGKLGDITRDAVIGKAGDDHPAAASELLGDAQRQVVGLAAGAGKHDALEVIGKGAQQLLGVIEHALLQVASVGVELRGLPADRLDHPGMTMPHRRHVIVGIQIPPALFVIQPHTFTAHRVQGVFVEQSIGRAEQPCPAFDKAFFLV